MSVITRFAPSPTGFLHIGSARTALFNYLFARHHNGKFMLRIEDTDRERSTKEAIDAILDGLTWLGLTWDEEPIFQLSRGDRHREIAENMLKHDKAYYCYCTPQELMEMREKAAREGKAFKYDSRWRDRDPKDAPHGIKPAIRLKAPRDGTTTIKDAVQGDVTIQNAELDDMVLLRSDGTPTYMLAVVVDDHDMNITHIIRGDDHLTNAARQIQIYDALGWEIPQFAHIPLIHGADGAKLSKRHGALGVDAYRDMGYLPEALRNYLLRLGWSHGNDEIISDQEAIEWFNLESIGKSPSRFDFTKLQSINAHYIKEASNERLVSIITPYLHQPLSVIHKSRLLKGMNSLKERAKTIIELAESAKFYVIDPTPISDKAKSLLTEEAKDLIVETLAILDNITDWKIDVIEESIKKLVESKGIGLGKIAQPLRVLLTGSTTSPGIFEIMEILGKEESIFRIKRGSDGI